MRGVLVKLSSTVVLPVSWTIFTVILLCLPGSAIPDQGVFSMHGLDKIVHVVLFGGIVMLWGYHYYKLDKKRWRTALWSAAFLTILLGTIMEFVQRYYIPGRSFDLTDIVADSAGALAAALLHLLLRKNT